MARFPSAPSRVPDVMTARTASNRTVDLDVAPVAIRPRLEILIRGGGKRGVELAARSLGVPPAYFYAVAKASPPDPDVPPGTLPEEYP
jgi:hypothetical protein